MSPLHTRSFSWLTLAGIPGYVLCFPLHVCMAGHMQHPPYAWWHFALDALWVALFAAAAFIALRRKLPRRARLSTLLLVLIVSRLALGSGGGSFAVLPELPIVIYLIVVALRRSRPIFARASRYSATTSSGTGP